MSQFPVFEFRKELEPSISGTGKGVFNVTSYSTKDTLSQVKGAFDENGRIVITGTLIYDLGLFLEALNIANEFNRERLLKIHWTDYLAIASVFNTGTELEPKSKVYQYHIAGSIWMDLITLDGILREIAESDGKLDWNIIIARKYPVIDDDTVQDDSPFNPKSRYYNPLKKVFSYDIDGYIIYESGEIIFTETGGNYYDPKNGIVISYDGINKVVTFDNNSQLNLITLVLVTAAGDSKTVSNTKAWYQKLLENTNLWIGIIVGLVILILLKKRNEQ